jgi:hypothetical protein
VKGFLDQAVAAVTKADAELGQLQDSMLPVEVGDADLRAGMSEVRRQLDDVAADARRLVSRLGR